MICCSIYCTSFQDICKAEKYHKYALNIYRSMLKPTIPNTFFKRTQLALILVIVNKEPKYKIS